MSTGIKLPFRVGDSPTLKIRGLIATELIHKDQVIERCPSIVYVKNTPVIEQTIFDHYVFDWDETHEALALGYGSLINHSYERNVGVDFDFEKKEIIFTALRDINVGEELFINYNDDSREPIDPGYLEFDKSMSV
jgi:SET domain-containing protein